MMSVFSNDLGRNSNSDSASEFMRLYLSDDSKLRSLGVRRLSWVCTDSGIISTTGDEFYLRTVLLFQIFTKQTESIINDVVRKQSPSADAHVGTVNMNLDVDSFMTVINLCNVATGNPDDSLIIEERPIPHGNSNHNLNFRQGRGQPRANSRSYSTKSSGLGKKLFKYVLILSNDEVVPIFSPYKLRMTPYLYHKIILDLGLE